MLFEPALVFCPPVYLKKHRKALRLPSPCAFDSKPGIGNNRHPSSASPLPQLDNRRLPRKPVADLLFDQPVSGRGATETPGRDKETGQDEIVGQLTETQMLDLIRPEIPISCESQLS